MDTEYMMACGRARHMASGLWHYVRAYGNDTTMADLALTTETLRRGWVLDVASIRHAVQTRQEALRLP